MPTPAEWMDPEYRAKLHDAAHPCTHEITEQVLCEPDCCGASVIWEECRCGRFIYVPGVGAVPVDEADT